jgi:O-sialoglycoprotein endopeptidase (EC 3.4.24.57)
VTRILAIETSCDETAAAVVEDGRYILSNIVASQVELHARYGGVFPEIASRAHIEAIVPVIEQAMREAHLGFGDLDAVAVTCGPGLAGSLLVGVNAAKGIALGHNLPLLGINHLEAHIYAHWLDTTGINPAHARSLPIPAQFPLVALVVSGGHTELILMPGHGRYEYLGGTLDDAAARLSTRWGVCCICLTQAVRRFKGQLTEGIRLLTSFHEPGWRTVTTSASAASNCRAA